MEPIALFYNGNIIYWNTIIIALGILSGCFLTWMLYQGRNRYATVIYLYLPLAIAGSVYLSRIFHWYCNREQYESFSAAVENLENGSFLIPGILFACWLIALLMQLLRLVRSRFEILDPLAPGLAMALALIKFSDIFTDACRGKVSVETPFFQKLPFAVPTMDSSGHIQYRMATFFLTFLLLLLIVALLLAFYASDLRSHTTETAGIRLCTGNTWRMFLVWYGAVEITMDSTRYDASHLYFPGEALANLNKASGFMGFSQLLGAIFCLYGMIYFTLRLRKIRTKWKYVLWGMFVILLGVAGVSEYFVQRHSSQFLLYFSLQFAASLLMGACVFGLYRLGVLKNESSVPIIK